MSKLVMEYKMNPKISKALEGKQEAVVTATVASMEKKRFMFLHTHCVYESIQLRETIAQIHAESQNLLKRHNEDQITIASLQLQISLLEGKPPTPDVKRTTVAGDYLHKLYLESKVEND